MVPLSSFIRVTGIAIGLFAAASSVVAEESVGTDTAFSDAGNAQKGQRIFNRCKACHNLTNTKRTRLGPNLNDLFARRAGSAGNFKYSKALQDADFQWSEAKLDEWLAKPAAFLPGNKMQFAGVRNSQDRKDLIAYLRSVTVNAETE